MLVFLLVLHAQQDPMLQAVHKLHAHHAVQALTVQLLPLTALIVMLVNIRVSLRQQIAVFVSLGSFQLLVLLLLVVRFVQVAHSCLFHYQ